MEKRAISARLNKDSFKKLKILAVAKDMKMTEILEIIIDYYIEKEWTGEEL